MQEFFSHNILLRKAKKNYVYKKVNTYILQDFVLDGIGYSQLGCPRLLKKHIHVLIKELSKEHSSKACLQMVQWIQMRLFLKQNSHHVLC
jgi:hypothetical protein